MYRIQNVGKIIRDADFFEQPDVRALAHGDLPSLLPAQELDRDGYLFNAVNTYANLFLSLKSRNYTWAIIQAYYTIFHLCRTNLAFRRYSIIYNLKGKPFLIYIEEGEKLKRLKGNSHEVVLKEFKKKFPNLYLLTNHIEEADPLDWFKRLREEVNYRTVPNEDPRPPREFMMIHDNLRKWITTVVNDEDNSYTFASDYAFFAFVTRLLTYTIQKFHDHGIKCKAFSKEKIDYLLSFFTDRKGPITSITLRLGEIADI